MKKKKGLLFFFFTLYILPQIYGLLFPEQILASPLVWKKSGNIDSYSQDLRVSPTNSNTIYATLRTGNLSGLYKSVDGGANFNPILPLITGRDVNSIAISSSSASFLWVSTYEQGVLKSIDDGNSWTTTSGILPKKTRYLTIDPTNENILYAGTGENNSDGGIYKSIDKGDTWNQVGASTYGYKNNLNIYVDKHNPNIVYAGSDFGLFRTINGGDAWENIFSNNTYPPATLVSITLGSTIYTSVPNQGIYKSTDNGLTWTLKNNTMGNSLIFRLAVDNNDTLYASRVISGGGVWRSKDGAETWENVGDSAWGTRNTWGLDVGGGRVFVGVEGLGIYYADTNSDQINPVVFIPGFLGSWSYKGLIENQPTTYADWQLTPYFTESFYQPLLLTLKNANLTDSGPNQNLFTFAYDYRKSVADTAAWLNTYLTNEVQNKNPGKKANVVAHSMGSLVARYCFEKISGCADKINKIVTAGGPHQGTIKAYQLWEGGEFAEDNILMKTVEDLVLHAAGFPYLIDKDIIQNRFPGVRDLLPVFDYISGKPYGALSSLAKNPILESLTPPSSSFVNNVTPQSGSNVQTASGFTITPLSPLEAALGLWSDGKPNIYTTAIGDGTILKSSSEIAAANNKSYAVEHKAYFQSATALNDILAAFNLSASSVVTAVSPSPTSVLIFLLHSPATINVFDSLGSVVGLRPDDKTIFIANPTNQNYQATITGTGTGNFQLDAFLIDSLGTTRQIINGSTAPGQTQNFIFNAANNVNSFSDNDGAIALTTFRQNNQISNHRSSRLWEVIVNRAVADIHANRRRASGFTTLEKTHLDLATALAKENSPSQRQNLLKTVNALTNLLIRLDNLYRPATTTAKANQEMARSQNAINSKLARSSLTTREAADLLLAQNFQSEAARFLSLGRSYQAILSARTANMLVN